MNLGITNKVALVAAASRGLGKAVAMRLSREGARVAICSRSKERIDAAQHEISQATGNEVFAVPCDVRDSNEIKSMIEIVSTHFGGIDILVTNAGGPPAGMAQDFTPEDYRDGIELNLMSTISMVYGVMPQMRKNKWGRIVAITSIAARQPVANLILSNTARAGVLGFIKTFSSQVATEGITMNSICPGYTRTERIDEIAEAFVASEKGSIEDFHRMIEADVPMGRMGTPEEFASAVAFLVSEGAAYITGIALPVDGGCTRGLY